MNYLSKYFEIINYTTLIYFIALTSIYFALNFIAYFKIKNYTRRINRTDYKNVFRLRNYQPITLIAPAYNESASIIESVKSFLSLEYPDMQLIVVNDGSKDDTLQKLLDEFKLSSVPYIGTGPLKTQKLKNVYASKFYKNLLIIDKENGGKADAINSGVNLSKNPLVCIVDADSILERDSLLKISRPFMEDVNVFAAGGIIRVANGCELKNGFIYKINAPEKWLPRFQTVEYLRAFLFGRTAFDIINAVMIISGAFSCFKKDLLIKAGGYLAGAIGEDMEIIVRMHKILRRENPNAKAAFIPDPVCWTETPEKFKSLARQRKRWQKGTMESLWLHKSMFLNPKYRWLGLFSFPYFLIFELLGPFIEAFGIIIFLISLALNIVSFEFAAAFFAAAILFGVALSTLSIILDELSFKRYSSSYDLIALYNAAFLESFGYRQFVSWNRLIGMFEYIFGKKSWGIMERKGFKSK